MPPNGSKIRREEALQVGLASENPSLDWKQPSHFPRTPISLRPLTLEDLPEPHPRFTMVGLSGSNSVVECDLAKVEVAGSNPVSRSRFLCFQLARAPITHQLGFGTLFARAGARYPSGKGEVCKTFMRRFDSDPRLQFFSLIKSIFHHGVYFALAMPSWAAL